MIDTLPLIRPLWIQLGVTLAHFLWQGAVVALLLWVGLWWMRHRPAGARYAACGLAMLVMAACPVGTLWYVRTHPLPALMAIDRLAERSGAISTIGVPSSECPDPQGDAPGISDPDTDAEGEGVQMAFTQPPVESGPLVTDRGQWLAAALSLGAGAWAFGVAMLGLRLMVGWVGLRRLVGRDAEPLMPDIEPTVGRLRSGLGIASRVRVLATRRFDEPLAVGLIKPVVLLPMSLLTQCPPDLLEAMIAHELAHIRRHDLWINLLQRIAETLLFYHPAVWWVSGRMRAERELCCDDLAVRVTGRRIEYAEALVRLSQASITAAPSLAAGLFGRNLTMALRVRRVLQIPQPPQQGRFWLAGPLSLLLAGSLILVARIHRADATPSVAADAPAAKQAPSAKDTAATSDAPTGLAAAMRPTTTPARRRGSTRRATPVAATSRPSAAPIVRATTQGIARPIASASRRRPARPTAEVLTKLRALGYASAPGAKWVRVWARTDGIIDRICVKERQAVKKGDLLVEFDNEETKIELEIAQARYGAARQAHDRLVRLGKKGQISTAELNTIKTDLRLAELEVRRWQARLDRTRLVSPMDGVVGTMFGHPMEGQMVKAGVFFVAVNAPGSGDTQPAEKLLGGLTGPVHGKSRMSRRRRSPAQTRLVKPPTVAAVRSVSPASAPSSVAVRSLADGLVASVGVKSGQAVKKGDVLIKLDDAEIKFEQKQAEVECKTLQIEYSRQVELYERKASSPLEIEKASAALELAKLKREQCALRAKRLVITSPADGVVTRVEPDLLGKKVEAGEMLMRIQFKSKAPAATPTAAKVPAPMRSRRR